MRYGTESKSIGYYLLRFGFPLVYALTVMPFTVQFFRRFVSSPKTDVLLFDLLPLPQVHEFFLPFFILALELISIQIAVGFWSSQNLGRKALLLGMFLGFQMFPLFSVYFDTRVTAFDNLQNSQPPAVDPIAEKKAQEDYDSAKAIYDNHVAFLTQDYNNRLANYAKDKSTLDQQIRDSQTAIDKANSQITSLASVGYYNLAQRDAGLAQIQQLQAQVNQNQSTLAQAQTKLNQLISNPPTAPDFGPAPVKQSPPSKAQPLSYEGDLDFLVKTLPQMDSLLALGVSWIFPIIVFGAGFVIAENKRRGHEFGELERGYAHTNLKEELEQCANLKPGQQKSYVKNLEPVIYARILGLRAPKTIAIESSGAFMKNELEIQVVEELGSLKGEILKSKVEANAKGQLVGYVDKLINEQMLAAAA